MLRSVVGGRETTMINWERDLKVELDNLEAELDALFDKLSLSTRTKVGIWGIRSAGFSLNSADRIVCPSI